MPILLLLCLVLFCGCSKPERNTTAQTIAHTPSQVLFAGDLSFSRSYELSMSPEARKKMQDSARVDYVSKELLSLLNQKEFAVANLETTLCNTERSPYAGRKPYIHQDEAAPMLEFLKKAGISAVSLANNHGFDYAEAGLMQTMRHLKKGGITYAGAGLSWADARKPLVRELAGSNGKLIIPCGYWRTRKYQEMYKFYAEEEKSGVIGWSRERFTQEVDYLRKKHPKALIIPFVHWGSNYKWVHNKQRELAYAAIDAGADMVVGHGSHMMQEIERYKNKWIIYGLGNLIFLSPGRYVKKPSPHHFSGLLRLEIRKDSVLPKIYPLVSDNLKTKYQPRPASDKEVEGFFSLLKEAGSEEGNLSKIAKTARDAHGAHLLLKAQIR